MYLPRTSFHVNVDSELIVPPWFKKVMFESIQAEQYPETPKILPIEHIGNGLYAVMSPPREHDSQKVIGFHLFVPHDVRVGDVLVIRWKAKTCAAATHGREDSLSSQHDHRPRDHQSLASKANLLKDAPRFCRGGVVGAFYFVHSHL